MCHFLLIASVLRRVEVLLFKLPIGCATFIFFILCPRVIPITIGTGVIKIKLLQSCECDCRHFKLRAGHFTSLVPGLKPGLIKFNPFRILTTYYSNEVLLLTLNPKL